jgi:hypothetical protein
MFVLLVEGKPGDAAAGTELARGGGLRGRQREIVPWRV